MPPPPGPVPYGFDLRDTLRLGQQGHYHGNAPSRPRGRMRTHVAPIDQLFREHYGQHGDAPRARAWSGGWRG
jgi:hypothetical protein